MTTIAIFTPTYTQDNGTTAMRPECRASVEAQVFDGALTWEIGLHNPWQTQKMRNVVAQYQRGRESFLASDADAWLTFEHDMTMPPDGAQRLWDTMQRTGAGVVYGVYMLRHGTKVLNAWEYIGDHALGESLTLYPEKLARARAQGSVRVGGVGWGCTLIWRDVVERFPIRDDNDGAGDIPFAYDCLYAGIKMIADFNVPCDHFDCALRLRADGNAMSDTVEIIAMQDVTITDGRQSRRLEAGRRYSIGAGLASDLMRAGYVQEVMEEEARPSPELAAMAAPETATVSKGRRRKGGGDAR